MELSKFRGKGKISQLGSKFRRPRKTVFPRDYFIITFLVLKTVCGSTYRAALN